MKVPYKYFINSLKDKPSLEDLSSKLFQLGHEHEIENNIFDFEITPNRGDCLSLKGLLRDLSPFYKINYFFDTYEEDINTFSMDFVNESQDFCPKITFLKLSIKNKVSEYRGELEDYFVDLNLSKNNFFTDVSNYIMYETGQPSHCYDYESIDGEIKLKEINHNEIFKSLMDEEIKLLNNNHVFTIDNEIINLAGIMGGKSTCCSEDTLSILLECAYFEPEPIMGKSVKYDIKSDAAHKFERGVDPLCHEYTIRRFLKIVSDHADIVDVKIFSKDYKQYKEVKIPCDHEKVNKILGSNISKNEFISYLESLSFRVIDDFIKVPSFRHDVTTYNDLSEEIARIIGYDNIKASKMKIENIKNNEVHHEILIKNFLIKNGFTEVINNPFSSENDELSIQIDNPLDLNKNFFRKSLCNSLIENLLYNERRQKDSLKLFEISDVYFIKDKNIARKRLLSIIASGRIGKNYIEFSKKINIEYMEDLFKKLSNNFKFCFQTISRDTLNTKSKSEIIFSEISLEELIEKINPSFDESPPEYKFNKITPISEYPSSSRDLSFLVRDKSKIGSLEDLIYKFKNPILKEVFLFDYYYNEKNKQIKMGYRFVYQSNNKTLTVEDIDKVMNSIIKKSLEIDSVEIPGI